jgi:hypothetical protein
MLKTHIFTTCKRYDIDFDFILKADQLHAIVYIADRCMNRLHKKAIRMLYAGKHKNKVKTACAWEIQEHLDRLGFFDPILMVSVL